MDKFGVVRTTSKDTNTPGQSRNFVSMTNSETRTGENRNIGLGNASAEPEVDNEKTCQRPNLDQHKATWDRQSDTTTSDATSRKRGIIRKSLEQHSDQYRRIK